MLRILVCCLGSFTLFSCDNVCIEAAENHRSIILFSFKADVCKKIKMLKIEEKSSPQDRSLRAHHALHVFQSALKNPPSYFPAACFNGSECLYAKGFHYLKELDLIDKTGKIPHDILESVK